jgi:hypothetical protein
MFTSCFASLKSLAPGLEPVAISQGIPYWFKGRRELRLAPSWEMLQQMTAREYDAAFAKMLKGLDPQALFDELGESACLLCWEQPGIKCHRRLVAEWFERSLGIVVPEIGFRRAACAAYAELPPKKPR